MAINDTFIQGFIGGVLQAAQEREAKRQQMRELAVQDPSTAMEIYGQDIYKIIPQERLQKMQNERNQLRTLEYLSKLSPEIMGRVNLDQSGVLGTQGLLAGGQAAVGEGTRRFGIETDINRERIMAGLPVEVQAGMKGGTPLAKQMSTASKAAVAQALGNEISKERRAIAGQKELSEFEFNKKADQARAQLLADIDPATAGKIDLGDINQVYNAFKSKGYQELTMKSGSYEYVVWKDKDGKIVGYKEIGPHYIGGGISPPSSDSGIDYDSMVPPGWTLQRTGKGKGNMLFNVEKPLVETNIIDPKNGKISKRFIISDAAAESALQYNPQALGNLQAQVKYPLVTDSEVASFYNGLQNLVNEKFGINKPTMLLDLVKPVEDKELLKVINTYDPDGPWKDMYNTITPADVAKLHNRIKSNVYTTAKKGYGGTSKTNVTKNNPSNNKKPGGKIPKGVNVRYGRQKDS